LVGDELLETFALHAANETTSPNAMAQRPIFISNSLDPLTKYVGTSREIPEREFAARRLDT
jgi:hypothetical protein